MNVYDFDKTIIPYDSTQAFFRFLFRKHPKLIVHTPKMMVAALKYVLKQSSKTQMKNVMYEALLMIDHLDEEVRLFWKGRIQDIQPWYLNQKTTEDVIISASPSFLLDPVCKHLNVHLIASNIDLTTGHHLSENCYGPEKPIRFAKEFSLDDIEAFYSDSYSDTPMAIHAKEAYIVKDSEIKPWDFRKKYSSYEH
jgi:HAD superfamily phosphoserine phosphatase-like hydrolase